MKTNTENDILDYLLHGNSLTVIDAIKLFHTTELRKYISNLRDRGYAIDDCRVKGKNALGESVNYNRYYIDTNDELPIAQVERANLEREYMQSRGV